MRAKKEPIDINEFIDNHPHPLKREIKEVRKIILACGADITEHIKWNAPSFCYLGDDRITFKLNKNDVVQSGTQYGILCDMEEINANTVQRSYRMSWR